MIAPREQLTLAPYTTFGIGGEARYLIAAHTEADVGEAMAFARERALPLFVLGGGSNVLVADEGFAGVVLKMEIEGIESRLEGDYALVEAGAGVSWDALVAHAARRGWWGLENLSGIPGTVGGAVAGNIGAYGQAVSDTAAWVDVVDRASGARERLAPRACAFGYRASLFRREPRYVILRAAFMLPLRAAPNVGYRDFAGRLDPAVFAAGNAAPARIREVVLAIRSEKFPDLSREGSAGSFFKNVIVSRAGAATFKERYPGMPLFPMPETAGVKVPVAWLLDRVLRMKGYAKGRARLFERQPLVVVAAPGARAADVEDLARDIERRMRDTLGIALEREVETLA